MATINEKMTGLANAIRSKTGVSSALSIDGMTAAVEGITTGGSGGADVSGVTATPDDVLASAKFVDKTGTLKSGTIQTVTLTRNGNTVSVQKGYVAENASITIESSGSSTCGVELYRCVSYDNGGVIPAYSNIVLSGSTADVNGTYTRSDATTPNKYAKWIKGVREVYYNSMDKCWVVNDTSANPTGVKSGSLYYADAPYLSVSNGTPADPYTWDSVQSDTPCITKWLTNAMCCKYNLQNSTEYNCLYIQLYMEAGIEYQIGRKYPEDYYYGVTLELYDTTNPYGGYIRDISGSSAFTVGDIEFTTVNKYKVDNTGMYLLCVKAYSSGYSMTDVILGFDHNMDIPSTQADSPFDVASWTAGTGSGSITVAKVEVAERPATGIKVWSGAKASQADDYTWEYADTATTGLSVIGLEPAVGKTYSADTTVEVAQVYSLKPPTVDSTDLMVCLAHFDGNYKTFVDATESCIVEVGNQAAITHEVSKFGAGCWEGNYLNPPEGGVNVSMLPLLDAFTIEWWQWYRGTVKFGGAVMAVMDDSWEWKFLNGVSLLPGHPLYKKQEWFHHAFVREKGSSTVTEYISGIPVATHTWEGLLGGASAVWFGAGGSYGANHNNRGDELAVFSYAKYHGAFTPNDAPYPNINSGLNIDTEEREVAVEGLTGIHLANKRSYALLDQEATGTDRVWITADGKWRICCDNTMDTEWVVTNREPDYDGNHFVIARLEYDWETEDVTDTDFDPIGHTGWKDAVTGVPIRVIRLKNTEINDNGGANISVFYLTGCDIPGVNGRYVYNSSPSALSVKISDSTTLNCSAWFNGDYCVHWIQDPTIMSLKTVYVSKRDNIFNTLYKCEAKNLYIDGYKWTCVNGAEPVPVISLTKPLT